MQKSLVKEILLTSKTLASNTEEVPKLQAIGLEICAHKQILESLFSDSTHITAIAKGKIPKISFRSVGQRSEARLINLFSIKSEKSIPRWLKNLSVEEALSSFQGSDVLANKTEWSSLRTILPSRIENDLKYRLSIHELYVDRIKINIVLYFNKLSYNHVRSRETLLRLNHLPVRLVARLVNNDN